MTRLGPGVIQERSKGVRESDPEGEGVCRCTRMEAGGGTTGGCLGAGVGPFQISI